MPNSNSSLVVSLLLLSSCASVPDFATALARHPRVCVSDVVVKRKDDKIAFFAVVHNVGIEDSKVEFEVEPTLLVGGPGQNQYPIQGGGYFRVPSSVAIKGTAGNPASSAGPNLLIDEQYRVTSSWDPYVPYESDRFIKVLVKLRSNDSNFKIASSGCDRLEKYFYGERPI